MGPQVDNRPWVIDPSAVPSTIAHTLCQNVRPKYSGPRMPTPTVANSMFGRGPGPQQLPRPAVSLVERNHLDAAGFDGDDAVSVVAGRVVDDDGGG